MATPMEQYRIPLFIVSFHRSGSSLTAHMFHAAGMNLGEKLLGAKPSNPYGHFEDKDVISINDRILKNVDHAWFKDRGPLAVQDDSATEAIKRFVSKRFVEHQSFGMKDPRFCLTMRHWHATLGRVRVLFVHRGGPYCVSSLWNRALRDHRAGQAVGLNHALVNDPDHIARMYAHNTSSFLSWYNTLPDPEDSVIFANYEDIITGQHDVVGHCRDKWGYELKTVRAVDFYDRNAVTATSDWGISIRDPELDKCVSDLDAQVKELCRS